MTPPLILVTETEAAQQQAVRTHLEETGFRVVPSGGAAQIFQALATMPVGVIVLDAALRGADGMDLCRDVRARSEVPVILVGANSSEVDRVVALELGADDYINKPYSARELAARLRAVLRRGRG
ncbi:response regulator transcription factor, partial [Sphingobium sp. ba1]